jgi:DNA-binding response OmpR family regulator
MQQVFIQAHHQVSVAQTGREALRLAEQFKPAVAFIDLELPDMSGTELIRALRPWRTPISCILVTRFGDHESKAEAILAGAYDCLSTPVTGSVLLSAVDAALTKEQTRTSGDAGVEAEHHSLSRWAAVVVRGVRAPRDFRTLPEFGRAVGVSSGAFRNWCRTANLRGRDSLRFTRVLRAVILQSITKHAPEDLLNIVDRRTLAKLMIAAGGTCSCLPPNVLEFLERQRFIDNPAAIAAVRAALGSMVDQPQPSAAPPPPQRNQPQSAL